MANKISNDAVKKRTGKNWQEWYKLLDDAGARKMNHKDITTWIYYNNNVSGWWAQMITTNYEQAVKGRMRHEKPGGFEISKGKTVSVPISKLYSAWEKKLLRDKWLSKPNMKIKNATPGKSMLATWVDEKTTLNVYFYNKGKDKSQVSVQHLKLKDSREAEKMKKYWDTNLSKLKKYLEATNGN
jgi:uncharacterized protein YndB with AHSA1/START domain